MIVTMKKILLMGEEKSLDAFFKKAQEKGILEFIGSSRKKIEDPSLQILSQAVRILKNRQVILAQTKSSLKEPLFLAKEVIAAKEALEVLLERKRALSMEISRIHVFGDFSLEDKEFIEREGKRVFQYFAMKREKTKETLLSPSLQYVGTEYDLDYFIAIHKERKSYSGMIEIFIEKPLGELKQELQEVEKQQEEKEKTLKELTAHLEILRESFIEKLNTFHLKSAKENVMRPLSHLFASQAWIPSSKEALLQEILAPFALIYEVIRIESKDKIPTYMENQKTAKIGEDLVDIYDTPSREDKDPSSWVFWFFSLFFAMIVSDAGYGFIYLALALFLKWKYSHRKGLLKRFSNLILTLSLFCIGWGGLTGSFFGLQFSLNSPFRKISILQFLVEKKVKYHFTQKDDVYEKWVQKFPALKQEKSPKKTLEIASSRDPAGNTKYEMLTEFEGNILMEISLFIGVVHLIIAFLRNAKKNAAGFGWIVFMIGGYLFFPYVINATTSLHFLGLISKVVAETLGFYLLFFGIGLAVVLAVIQQRLKGIAEIMNVIQVFADVLSYLRLYALALASLIMAATFNEIGERLGYLGILAIMIGHGTNIILGIMGGVIHGLRLNFLEWYRYCFEGGGRLFDPLRFIIYERG